MPSIALVGDAVGAGLIQNSQGIATTINGTPVAVAGDTVTAHPPCPRVQSHCVATMTAGTGVTINGIPIVVDGNAATCTHVVAASAQSAIK